MILLTVKSATHVQRAGAYPAPNSCFTPPELSQRYSGTPPRPFSCHLSVQNRDCTIDQLVRVFIILGLGAALQC